MSQTLENPKNLPNQGLPLALQNICTLSLLSITLLCFSTDQTEWRFVPSVSSLVRGGNRIHHCHSHEPTADLAGVPLPGVDTVMHLLRRDH